MRRLMRVFPWTLERIFYFSVFFVGKKVQFRGRNNKSI